MLRVSKTDPSILLNESLGMAELVGSPLCFNGMKLLAYARDNDGIQLTKSGGFFRKLVEWAAEDFHWPDYEADKLYSINKVLNEQDFPPLAVMHDLMRASRLLRHAKGRAKLTKDGKAILGDYGRLQALLFDTYFTGLDLSEYERFPVALAEADIAHCVGVVDNRLNEWVPVGDFTRWCIPVDAIKTWRVSPETDACLHVLLRVVRPLSWLGLLEKDVGAHGQRIEDWRLRKSPLFGRFVRFIMPSSGMHTIH